MNKIIADEIVSRYISEEQPPDRVMYEYLLEQSIRQELSGNHVSAAELRSQAKECLKPSRYIKVPSDPTERKLLREALRASRSR